MQMDKMNLENMLRPPKFSAGPTVPNPGPTLPRHVITEEKHVIKSAFSRAMRSAPTKPLPCIKMCDLQ